MCRQSHEYHFHIIFNIFISEEIAETKLKSWKFIERDSLELPIDVDIYLLRKSIRYDDIDRGKKNVFK